MKQQIRVFLVWISIFLGIYGGLAAAPAAIIAINDATVQLDENDAIAQKSFRDLITQAWTKKPASEPYRIALVRDEGAPRGYFFGAQSLHDYFTGAGAGSRGENPLTRQHIHELGVFDVMPLPLPASGSYPDDYFQIADIRFNLRASRELAELVKPHLNVIVAPPARTDIDFDLLLKRLAVSSALVDGYDAARNRLSFDSRHIDKIPSHFFTELARVLPHLKIFSAVGNRLAVLPDSIGELSELETLLLGKNLLRTLPHSIGNLKNLKFLSCYENNLEILPDELWTLSHLEELFLVHNQLSLVPTAVENLISLKTLNVSFNKIKILPDAVGNLTNLESLAFSGNAVEMVPDTLVNLVKLRVLSLTANKLSEFPNVILRLRNLRVLEIGDNPFPHISDEIVQLPNLQRLVCDTAKLSPVVLETLKKREIELE